MPETLDDFLRTRPPTAERPLYGRTILAVEDSRYVSDALRLMCQRSGARLRRADSLRSAARHLRTYRPSVVLVDLGLPDGSRLDLIEELNQSEPRVDVLLAMSGDDTLSDAARDAGADAFLGKPLTSLAEFQSLILSFLPAEAHPKGPRVLPTTVVTPDDVALRDDLQQVARVLKNSCDAEAMVYAEGFLMGLAKCAGDRDLKRAVNALKDARDDGRSIEGPLAAVSALLNDRIIARTAV